jgi:hypothetical protein
MAGSIVQLALRHLDILGADLQPPRMGTGRNADKLSIMQIGAKLLESMTGLDWIAPIVDDWCQTQLGLVENVLTNVFLPDSLSEFHMPRQPSIVSPSYVDDFGTVWFSRTHLSRSILSRPSSPRVRQLATEKSLESQYLALMESLGEEPMHTRKAVGMRGEQVSKRYLGLPKDVSSAIVERTGMILPPSLEQAKQRTAKRRGKLF